MNLPSIAPVDPPVATTLGECKLLDIVDLQHGKRVTLVDHLARSKSVYVLGDDGWRTYHAYSTPVLLVARVQLEGRGK